MPLKSLLVSAVCVYLFTVNQAVVPAASTHPCALTCGLRDEISKKHPGATVLSLADLEAYHRQMYEKDHGTRCPGLLKVDFYGDGRPTWALVLIAGEDPKRKAELVVARKVDDSWEIRSLAITDGTPVIWSEEPGDYQDRYREKSIRATNPVIVFVGYESWATLYAWVDGHVEEIWLSD